MSKFITDDMIVEDEVLLSDDRTVVAILFRDGTVELRGDYRTYIAEQLFISRRHVAELNAALAEKDAEIERLKEERDQERDDADVMPAAILDTTMKAACVVTAWTASNPPSAPRWGCRFGGSWR